MGIQRPNNPYLVEIFHSNHHAPRFDLFLDRPLGHVGSRNHQHVGDTQLVDDRAKFPVFLRGLLSLGLALVLVLGSVFLAHVGQIVDVVQE